MLIGIDLNVPDLLLLSLARVQYYPEKVFVRLLFVYPLAAFDLDATGRQGRVGKKRGAYTLLIARRYI